MNPIKMEDNTPSPCHAESHDIKHSLPDQPGVCQSQAELPGGQKISHIQDPKYACEARNNPSSQVQTSFACPKESPVKPVIPTVIPISLIKEKVILSVKNRAIRELNSRVELALEQQNQMYLMQRDHVSTDSALRSSKEKAAVDARTQQLLWELELEYLQKDIEVDTAAELQRYKIEQTAMRLEVQALQEKMEAEHQVAALKWNPLRSFSEIRPSVFAKIDQENTQGSIPPDLDLDVSKLMENPRIVTDTSIVTF